MKTILIIGLCFLSIFVSPAYGQQQPTTHGPWTKEDSIAINALVLYPDSIRLNIFLACEYPAAIVRIGTLQKSSSTAFAEMMKSYPKEEQEDIWNISRYPGLISTLAKNVSVTNEQLNNTIANYPTDIRELGIKYAKSNLTLIKEIDSLESQTNSEFEQTISYYSTDVQNAFHSLIKYPEILTLLNDHLNLTVRVGDHYKRDPQWVIHKADSSYMAEVRHNAEELQEWKQELKDDSNARNDLKKAANEYAENNGYKTSEVDKPRDSSSVLNYTCYSYPYWFGYPVWYPYAYWYPYPYWYDWGFYYGPYGKIVVFGLPSFYFMNWYFYYPRYWHHYPWLGGIYYHHYYGRRNRYNRNNVLVHNWVQGNRNYLPRDFATSRNSRAEAIKEVGQLHEAVGEKNGNIDKAKQNGYMQKNSSKFSALNPNPEKPVMRSEERIPEVRERPVRQPAVSPRVVQPNSNKVTPAPRNYNEFNRGQNYQRSLWESPQNNRPVPSRKYSPPVRLPGRR